MANDGSLLINVLFANKMARHKTTFLFNIPLLRSYGILFVRLMVWFILFTTKYLPIYTTFGWHILSRRRPKPYGKPRFEASFWNTWLKRSNRMFGGKQKNFLFFFCSDMAAAWYKCSPSFVMTLYVIYVLIGWEFWKPH